MGNRCYICENVRIFGADNISLGDDVYLNDGVILQASAKAPIMIGERVILSYGVMVLTRGMELSVFPAEWRHASAPVVIEDGAWIGAGAVVLPGITVGQGAVVAAGAVVTQNVAPRTMVAGVPARFVKTFTDEKGANGAGKSI
jgi:acetyltransferase-like isoleucine patch superfamily enzyme